VVRIATWNLENLFRPSGQAGASGAAAYDAKVQALTDTLLALAPDVLAVQEVGDTQALTDLGRQVGGPWHQATADPDRRGIRVGYLSRLPLTHLEQIVTFPAGLRPVQVDDSANSVDRMGRPALRARVQVAGRPVDLLTCHLKSKLLTFRAGASVPPTNTNGPDSGSTHLIGGPPRRPPSAPPQPRCCPPTPPATPP
jgi:hypothetical protein